MKVSIDVTVVWNVTSYNLVDRYVFFGGTVAAFILEIEWPFYSEDGSSSFLRRMDTYMQNHTASLPGTASRL
jgi:hypothetical protein